MPEHKPLTLRRNFSWTFVGNAIYAAAQWGMLTVLAKTGTPEMVGQFALGLAVTAPVILFANLQLRAVQATDAKRQYEFGDYLALRGITTALALAVISGIVVVSGYRLETALVILLVGLAKAFESGSDVFYGLFLQRERMERMAGSMIARGLLALAALSLGVYLTGSVAWGVFGMALAWAVVLFGYDVRSGALLLRAPPGSAHETGSAVSGLRPRWEAKTLGELAWLALPLGVVMALVSLDTDIPRYFIESYLGERELGIFAAMAYVMVAGNMVVHALSQSASPRLAGFYAARNGPEFRKLLLKLAGIGVVLGAAGMLAVLVAGREVLTILYGPEFATHVDVFSLLMAAAGISYVASFLFCGVTAARYFKVQVPLFASVACTVAVACLWLVPAAGLRGAAIASILAAAVQLCAGLAVVAYAMNRIRGRPSEETKA